MTHATEEFKQMLLQKKEHLERELDSEHLKKPLEQEEDLEGEADQVEEYAAGLSIAENLTEQLANVRSALQKIEEKTYGACEACGMDIEKERLMALPEAKTCEHCQGS